MKRLESLTGFQDSPFPTYRTPLKEPYPLIDEWINYAYQQNVVEPDAYTLATYDSKQNISMRVIILSYADNLFRFATHSCSKKITDIQKNGYASGHIYWKELGRQLYFSGKVKKSSDEHAERSWYARSHEYDPVSVVSRQSHPLQSIQKFKSQLSEYNLGQKLIRPERYCVYEIEINQCEFWAASSDRIHKRLTYKLQGKQWQIQKLQP